jgi:voltage-gated sodium channel
MVAFAKRLTESRPFCWVVTSCIVLNAVLLGVETSVTVMARHGDLLYALNYVFKVIFVVEIALRLTAAHPNYRRWFSDGWNVFDFVIVAVTTVPLGGDFANVGRVLRLLRVIRLVSVSDELKLIVGTMFRSIPSMGHVIGLLSMLLYVYGVAGFYLFSKVDPVHFGTLGRALLTLFQVVTLEGWADIQRGIIDQKPWAWLYFGSFIVVGVFVVINLFIAVVINNLEKAKEEEQMRADAKRLDRDLLLRLERLKKEITELETVLRSRG